MPNIDSSKNEASIHLKLSHQHVVKLITSFEDEFSIYMILEACVNGSLRDLVSERSSLCIVEVRYFIKQILHGLQYIHQNDIIHRDIKPANVLIDDRMQIKIADFGLAIKLNSAKSQEICGTTLFLAPEVVEKFGADQKSDIWAVAVTTYNLLFGEYPFTGKNKRDIFAAIRTAKYT